MLNKNQMVDYTEQEKIKNLLIGHSVKKVDYRTLILDNGTQLQIIPNEGCGGCTSGLYEIEELNECSNIITNVIFEEGNLRENDTYADYYYKIFIFADNKKINLLTVSGTDGNGYYGSGYDIRVIYKEAENNE